MYRLIVLSTVLLTFLTVIPFDSSAHQSGCHRWHSCPSHDGNYKCGDLGYDSQCSKNGNNDSDDDKESKKSKSSDEKKSLPKSTSSEAIELSGTVTYVVDGDTLDVNDVRVRLALVDTPERGEKGYNTAKNFVKNLCLGEKAEVDIDDGQRGGDRYGREIGIVYCNGVNVNAKLLEKEYATIYREYCDVSEFANDDWVEC